MRFRTIAIIAVLGLAFGVLEDLVLLYLLGKLRR